MKNFRDPIKIDPNKRFGRPCVRETRIAVYDVLSWLSQGMTYEEIMADFRKLTKEDILACLAYAADREHNTQVA